MTGGVGPRTGSRGTLRLNRIVYRAHKWLGLSSGLALVVIGLTGSFVAFGEELDGALARRPSLTSDPTSC